MPVNKKTTDQDQWMVETGLDTVGRKINVFGPIDDTAAEKIFNGLTIFNRSSTAPITINLNTYGGDVTAGFAIYDAIRMSQAPVNILATGALFSMGAVIMQAAPEGRRMVTEHCTIMLHYGYDGYEGDSTSFLSWANHGKHIQKVFCEILSKKTGKTPSFWRRRLQSDLVLTAPEAKNLNLIDVIVE